MNNNSKKLVILGLVSILLIAGLYPVFSDANQPEITKMDGKIQTVKAVAGDPCLIVTVDHDGQGPVCFEREFFTVIVKVQNGGNVTIAAGASVSCAGATISPQKTNDKGKVVFQAKLVDHDQDFTIGVGYDYNGNWLSGSGKITVKDNYLILVVTPTTVNEGDTFNVKVTDHWGVYCVCWVNFDGSDYKVSGRAGRDITTIHLPIYLPSKTYDLYAHQPGYQNSNTVTITVLNVECPPDTPTVSGPSSGIVGWDYTFSAVTSDPDINDVKYIFDWGDGSDYTYTDFTKSGTPVDRTHRWEATGNFKVTVEAIDNSPDALRSQPSYSKISIINNAPSVPSLDAPGYLNASEDGKFSASATDPDGHPVKYYFRFNSDNGNQVESDSGTIMQSFSHGIHTAQAMAQDKYGAQSKWSSPKTIVVGNFAPDKPSKPTKTSRENNEFVFTSSATDINGKDETDDGAGDKLEYYFDFGDGTYSGWFGGYGTGETASVSHTFSTQKILETFHIRVKARDNHLAESDWSDDITVTIKKSSDSSTSIVPNDQQNSNNLPISQPDSNDLLISQSPTNTGTSSTGSCGITTFSAYMTYITVGQTLTFTAQPSGGASPYMYSWDLAYGTGYGTFSSSKSISRYFASSGTYTINVRVKDVTGAIRTASQTVTISSGSSSPSSSSSSTVSQPSKMTTNTATNN